MIATLFIYCSDRTRQLVVWFNLPSGVHQDYCDAILSKLFAFALLRRLQFDLFVIKECDEENIFLPSKECSLGPLNN